MTREEDDFSKYYDRIEGEEIGEGRFSKVYKVKDKESNNLRAIKIMDIKNIRLSLINELIKQDVTNELNDIIKSFHNQIEYLQKCSQNNKNSVKYYEYFYKEDQFAIVMELCDGNLLDLIKLKRGFTIEEIREIMEQLNNSLQIMSQNNIPHRDLTLENILIKYENKEKTKYILKLSDYGISNQLLSLSKVITTKIGTQRFMAPEVLDGKKNGSESALWSIGVILYLLYFKNFPYTEIGEANILKQIQDLGNKYLKESENPIFDDLIRKLLVMEPEKRITWEQYFNHPFFNKKNKSEIKMTVLINKTDKKDEDEEFKNIFFLENDLYKETTDQNHNFINELNQNNSELYINDKRVNFCKYFKPEKEGEYKIKIINKEIIKNCSHLFWGCGHIISLDLSSFDSSNVTDMSHMFSNCFGLKEINLNNLNTEKVKDMSYMFNKCSLLTKISFPNSFNTQNVVDMNSMFNFCQVLSEINFSPSFKTNNVTNMHLMFGNCYNIKSLDLNYFSIEKVVDMSNMFDQCKNLETILYNEKTFVFKKTTNVDDIFNQCINLKKDIFPFNNDNKIEYKHMLQMKNFNLSIISNNANMAAIINENSNLQLPNLNPDINEENNKINGKQKNKKKKKKVNKNLNTEKKEEKVENAEIKLEFDLVNQDPFLKPYKDNIKRRYEHFKKILGEIEKNEKSLKNFALSYETMGVHILPNGDIKYREYAPGCKGISLFGDFNDWKKNQ